MRVVAVCMLAIVACSVLVSASSVDDYFVYTEDKSDTDTQEIEVFNGIFTLCEHGMEDKTYVVQCKGRASVKKWAFFPPGKFVIETDLPQADGNSYDVEVDNAKACKFGRDICIHDNQGKEAVIMSRNFFKARAFGGYRATKPCKGAAAARCRRTAGSASRRIVQNDDPAGQDNLPRNSKSRKRRQPKGKRND
jgi:hypothetical protein